MGACELGTPAACSVRRAWTVEQFGQLHPLANREQGCGGRSLGLMAIPFLTAGLHTYRQVPSVPRDHRTGCLDGPLSRFCPALCNHDRVGQERYHRGWLRAFHTVLAAVGAHPPHPEPTPVAGLHFTVPKDR